MAWEEWEQLKAVAVERHTTQMQLNQLPADQGGSGGGGGPWDSGGGSDGMRSDKTVWTKAGTSVGGLREPITKALARMADGQTRLGKDSECLTAAAQLEVYGSWKRYLQDVSKRCGKLAELFEKVGNDQLKTDEAIKAEIAGLKVQYEDTPAVGGKSEGR
ncbi:hypothetical protein AB0N31_16510 [Streptomyces sp. NPDC051051]|uniref:hypothetical protein n=1 Tax=Streptomyces sp. NPDC051051 TaxID=3155666 RepID=UPI0034491767